MGRLAGKIALIMGGGADGPPGPGERVAIGNGRAIAMVCAREGARVMVGDRNPVLAEETAAEIRAEGHDARAVACDLLDEEQCRGAVEAAAAAFGGLHLLANNAGITDWADVANTTEADFARIMDVNVKGYFLAMKHAIPRIGESGGGAIVNISSLSARRAVPGSGVAYDTSKAALGGLMRSAAATAAPRGVRVNNLLPGFIDSAMLRKVAGGVSPDFSPKVPLGRMGSPWDVARVAAFLLSDDAAYVTGIELCVDGGATALI